MLAKPAVGKERGRGCSSYGRHRRGCEISLCPCRHLLHPRAGTWGWIGARPATCAGLRLLGKWLNGEKGWGAAYKRRKAKVQEDAVVLGRASLVAQGLRLDPHPAPSGLLPSASSSWLGSIL